MSPKPDGSIKIDAKGRLVIPPRLAKQLGYVPGQRLAYRLQGRELRLAPSTEMLARVYLEPTNACNLDCTTCMRNVWNEPMGQMSDAVFERFLAGLNVFHPRPLVFFGGIGEPFAHPGLLGMIRAIKQIGCPVEVITNATLLDEETAYELIKIGLDRLWVSLDGASPSSYADVRLGAELPGILKNLAKVMMLKEQASSQLPEIGIAFVAMRNNIADLPAVLETAHRLGANRVSVTHVLAHTPALRQQILYEQCLVNDPDQGARMVVDLPRIDFSDPGKQAWIQAFNDPRFFARVAGEPLNLSTNRCPFVERGSLSIRWDGAVSPCLPLLHTHIGYLGVHPRTSVAAVFGNILERNLNEIWFDADYQSLRNRLQFFDFSPCVSCNSCEYAEQNIQDCFGNTVPACGGCLWAQGLIQCP